MADEEHVKRLNRSVQEWNDWRREHREIRPDLSEADLSNANLSKVDLNMAHLEDANLTWSDLTGAELMGADLSRAKLRGANLSNVELDWANLIRSDLSRANLSQAVLIRAILSESNVRGAVFTEASFGYTIFAHIDLSHVEGLGTTKHSGPSTININSVTLPSDEPTRMHFLRGIGFTETQIEYLPSLLAPRPIQYASLFISSASEDDTIAQRLYRDLRKKDVLCWFAPHDLQPGNYFRERIDQAIHKQDKLLLLLSEHSVKSGWVRYEVELALARENRELQEILFPVRLDDAIFHCQASWAMSLQATRHIGDLTDWQDEAGYQQAFSTLLQHLKMNRSTTL